jgi:MATE family multidrug resistance protein
VAQLAGAGRYHEIGPLFRQVVWLAVVVGLLALGAVRWGGPTVVALAGVPDELAGDVDAYLRAVSLALPAIGLFMACRGLSDGLSLPIPTMVLSLSGLILLIPTGWALMYGAFGLPTLGAAGTGYAGALVDWIGVAVFATWIRLGKSYRRVPPASGGFGPDWNALAGLLKVGLPMGVSIVLEVGLFTVATLAVGRLGDVATASHQVALNVAAFVFMFPLGLSSAITVRVGHAVGRGDALGLRRAVISGLLIVGLIQTLTY